MATTPIGMMNQQQAEASLLIQILELKALEDDLSLSSIQMMSEQERSALARQFIVRHDNLALTVERIKDLEEQRDA